MHPSPCHSTVSARVDGLCLGSAAPQIMGTEVMVMTKRNKRRGVGPPRGRGHYSEDGRSWWDEAARRWFPVTDAQDTLEIELEDAGGTSMVASLLATLGSTFGNAYYRFVGRAHSADPRWPTYAIFGKTFPAPRAFSGDLPPQDQWAEGMTQALNQLREELLAQGWRPVGHRAHPWSFTYLRPGLDLIWSTTEPTRDAEGHRTFLG